MSDEVREATVNENQKLAAPEEQITKPAPKVSDFLKSSELCSGLKAFARNRRFLSLES